MSRVLCFTCATCYLIYREAMRPPEGHYTHHFALCPRCEAFNEPESTGAEEEMTHADGH